MAKKPSINRLKVTPGNIIVEQILEDEEIGGLLKSAQYEDKAYMGRVLLSGEGSSVKPGDTVYFNKYSSTAFPFEGKGFLLLKNEDIIAYSS